MNSVVVAVLVSLANFVGLEAAWSSDSKTAKTDIRAVALDLFAQVVF
jgi:hypothetical protein